MITYNRIALFSLLALALLTLSCKDSNKGQKEQAIIENTPTDSLVSDTITTVPDSILNKQHEEPDSLDGWILSSGGTVYYKDVMLTMPIVDIINPQLKMYLSDYIVPLVKRKGFYSKDNFIFVSYITEKHALYEIEILVDFCGITYRIARDIYEGKYQVAFIDGIPIMFEDFKAKGFIRATSQIFEFREWGDFIWLMTCELETKFFFSVVDGNIYYRGYYDWGLDLVQPDSKLPEVWNPEQREQVSNIPTDLITEDGDSISTKLINEEPDTIN